MPDDSEICQNIHGKFRLLRVESLSNEESHDKAAGGYFSEMNVPPCTGGKMRFLIAAGRRGDYAILEAIIFRIVFFAMASEIAAAFAGKCRNVL